MQATGRPVIGFLTDFGLDGAAATCRAVMLGICPDAQVVDIAHTVRKYAIRDGAFLLRNALPYFPVGVHVGVVDPGVGTARRPIAIQAARGDVLIGPDNGLLAPAAEALGGIREVRELANRALWLPAASSTFHGRDIFAPVAAHLANGDAEFEAVGPAVKVDSLTRQPEPGVDVTAGRVATEVVYVDSFGNMRLGAGPGALHEAFTGIEPGATLSVRVDRAPAFTATFARTFGDVDAGAALLYADSGGQLALGRNQGHLAADLRTDVGAAVVIEQP